VHSGSRFRSGCFPFAGFCWIPLDYEFVLAFLPEPCRNAMPGFFAGIRQNSQNVLVGKINPS
jgi:hypothetical protein